MLLGSKELWAHLFMPEGAYRGEDHWSGIKIIAALNVHEVQFLMWMVLFHSSAHYFVPVCRQCFLIRCCFYAIFLKLKRASSLCNLCQAGIVQWMWWCHSTRWPVVASGDTIQGANEAILLPALWKWGRWKAYISLAQAIGLLSVMPCWTGGFIVCLRCNFTSMHS